MPAGTSTGSNDALTAARFGLTASVDTHRLVSSLQRSGISFAGAQQFSQGQPVTNAADRRALGAVLSVLLQRSSTPR
jgi:hypothetical protein